MVQTSTSASLTGRKLIKLLYRKETLLKSSQRGKPKGLEALESTKLDKLQLLHFRTLAVQPSVRSGKSILLFKGKRKNSASDGSY